LDEPLPIEDTNSPVHDTWSLEGGIGATRRFVSDFFGGYHASRLLTAEAKTWWNAESVPRISLPSTVTLASISSASPRVHTGAKRHVLSVSPEGVIIRLPIPIEIKDLPKPVADAVAKAAPGETVKGAEKQEMRATLRYVALDKASVQRYAIDMIKDGKTKRFFVSPDGKSVKAIEIAAEKKASKPAKEFDVPAKAAKAVAALKALYPDLAVLKITHEVFDDGTGDIEILTYEVEFVIKGIEREMVASPEGVIPHLWASVATKDLPKAVTDALDKAAPRTKIEKARAFEIRASLRFGALEKAKLYYTVQVAKDGKERTLKVKPTGDLIQKFEFRKKK